METLFSVANTSVLPCWLLLLVAPGWRWTQRICTLYIPLTLGCLYAWLLSGGLGEGNFSSLEGVMALFREPRAVFAGWVHYLVFDLFTGAWEARDAAELGISRWAVAPCLLLTFLFGPVGLMLYVVLRGVTRQRWGVA